MKILICGVGAIGSNLVTNLVPDLKGEHDITILDKDVIEERNLTAGTQRYTSDQVGLPKVDALQYNVYKWFNREIEINQQEVEEFYNISWDLVIDCFDNHDARNILQTSWRKSYADKFEKVQIKRFELLHIGFSDNFTFAVEWAEHYKVPTDITSRFDICEMPGAAAFVASVASLGALVAEQWIQEGKKIEIIGGKYVHSLVK